MKLRPWIYGDKKIEISKKELWSLIIYNLPQELYVEFPKQQNTFHPVIVSTWPPYLQYRVANQSLNQMKQQ